MDKLHPVGEPFAPQLTHGTVGMRLDLEKARMSMQRRFKLGPSGDWRESATGEPYREVCSGGLGCPAWFTDPELAIKSWCEAVDAYAKNTLATTLYWRILPELGERHADGETLYAVYSRFLLSDKPQIQPAIKAASPDQSSAFAISA